MKKRCIELALLSAGMLLLCGCGGKEKETEPVAEPVIEETEETEGAAEEEIEEEKPDYSNLVTDVLNETIQVKTYYGEDDTTYIIPEIHLEGDEIKALNQKIYDKYIKYYNETKADGQQGWYDCNYTEYEWSVYEDQLTLILGASLYPDASGWTEYEVFSVDIPAAHVMEKSEVVEKLGISQEEYRETVRDAMGKHFCNMYEKMQVPGGFLSDSFNRKQLGRTVADENVTLATPYLNEEGQFCILARIYSLAAGDYYPHLICVDEVGENAIYSQYKGDQPASSQSKEVGSDADYILPESSTRNLTESDIAGLSAKQIRIAINEIFARHGRRFKDQELQAYFDSKSWYKGTVDPDSFSNSVFNSYETKNLDFLNAHR